MSEAGAFHHRIRELQQSEDWPGLVQEYNQRAGAAGGLEAAGANGAKLDTECCAAWMVFDCTLEASWPPLPSTPPGDSFT